MPKQTSMRQYVSNGPVASSTVGRTRAATTIGTSAASTTTEPNTGTKRKRAATSTKKISRKKVSSSQEAHSLVDTSPPSPELRKRQPSGVPPVWGDNRQEICESLKWYRSYESGAYFSDNYCWGFLLAKDSSNRAYLDGNVIITRSGGSMGEDANGTMKQIRDHSVEKGATPNLMKNLREKVAIAFILGDDNLQAKIEIPHPYCVMDWFQVTHIWPEKNDGKVCYKFRFEKLNHQVKSWWVPQDEEHRLLSDEPAILRTCAVCHSEHPQIFQEEWVCLEASCRKFYLLESGVEVSKEARYNTAFLAQRTEWQGSSEHMELVPSLPKTQEGLKNYDRESWKGIVCPKCHRCNSRVYWTEWRCKNCQYRHVPTGLRIIEPSEVRRMHEMIWKKSGVNLNEAEAWVEQMPTQFLGPDARRLTTYQMAENIFVSHLHADEDLNGRPGGADDIFRDIQARDIELKRGFVGSVQTGKAAKLSNHYSKNFGMDYKYSVRNAPSTPLTDAPASLMRAMKIMIDTLKFCPKDTESNVDYLPFNELLAVGYMEGGSMNYHDDGEHDLGPTIGTMSLGCTGRFCFRIKKPYWDMLEARLKLKNPQPDSETPDVIRVVEEYYRRNPGMKPKRMFLDMKLGHGDIVVMHGHGLQKYCEHTMVPQGGMRFALTVRHVRPEKHPKEKHWLGEYDQAILNALPDTFASLSYEHAKGSADRAIPYYGPYDNGHVVDSGSTTNSTLMATSSPADNVPLANLIDTPGKGTLGPEIASVATSSSVIEDMVPM